MTERRAEDRLSLSSGTDDALVVMVLARRAAAGDDAATRQFLDKTWPAITRVVAGVLGHAHPDKDDVVQQSLIALLRALPAFRGDCHAAGYASRIALHVALRARRRLRLERTRREDFALSPADAPKAPSPGDAFVSEERRRVLRDLLEDLPEEQADALGLRVVLGWSLEEVARATGVPMNTVRSRVRLAKDALRKRIEATPHLADHLEGHR
jgi:RNA polymerase sigma-70 factor (ECF subfamily)